ncbi:MAG: hypothetical protein ACK4YP_00210 [Myxococcota bacterium]
MWVRSSPPLGTRVAWLLLLGPACAPEVVDAPVPDTIPDTGDPWYMPPEEAAETWSIVETEAAFQAALAIRVPTPEDIVATYVDFMSRGDGTCPGEPTYFDDIVGCETADGWRYAGIAGYSATVVEEPDGVVTQVALYGDFAMVDPEGRRFAEGGGLGIVEYLVNDGTQAYDGNLRGIFEYPGSDTSFADGLSALVYITAKRPPDGATTLGLDGGIGLANASLQFEALEVGADGCDGATGKIGIRDTFGRWYVLDFGETCATCGPVTITGGEALGEACLDLRPFAETYGARLFDE